MQLFDYKVRGICYINQHKHVQYLGDSDLVKVEYCHDCQGLRLQRTNWAAPYPSSIEKVAQVVKELTPKVRLGRELPTLPLKEDVARACEDRYGMSPATVRRSLWWLVNTGKRFGLSMDGILREVQVGIRGNYEAYVRLVDVDGDPPAVFPSYRCVTCGRLLPIEDLVLGEVFGCLCDSFFMNGNEVEPTLRFRATQVHTSEGDRLRIEVGNLGGRTLKLVVGLFLNGAEANLMSGQAWSLAPGEQAAYLLDGPVHFGRTLVGGDALEAIVHDLNTREVLAWSRPIVWEENRPCCDHNLLPVVAGVIGLGLAIITASGLLGGSRRRIV